VGQPGSYGQLSLSPDERDVAVSVYAPDGSDLWLMDVASGRSVRATSEPGDEAYAVWSPDGDELAFSATRDIYSPVTVRKKSRRIDEESSPLIESDKDAVIRQWTEDGRLLYVSAGAEVWVRPLLDEGPGALLIGATTVVDEPRLSNDGRWIAYVVNESDLEGLMGDWQVHVAPFDSPSDRVRVSPVGGFQPQWRADGEELIYMRKDGVLMAASIEDQDGRPSVGTPTELFPLEFPRPSKRDWQMRGDGQSFLVKRLAKGAKPDTLNVVLNWTELLSR
jgi:Tol biopolymer transport system component